MILRGKNTARNILNTFLYGFLFVGIASLASTSLFSKPYSSEKPLVTPVMAEDVITSSDGDSGPGCDGSSPDADCASESPGGESI